MRTKLANAARALLSDRALVERDVPFSELARLPWAGCAEIFGGVEEVAPEEGEPRNGWDLGELYQRLDRGAVKKWAFCQTPRFVAEWLAERTIGAALAGFEGEPLRVLDPACGTGHLLIPSLRLLLAAALAPHRDNPEAAFDAGVAAFHRLVGVDLNPLAVALCRFRLVLEFVDLCGGFGNLWVASQLNPDIRAGDALAVEPGARGEDVIGGDRFHVILTNPPYIVEPVAAKRDYDRQRYESAYAKYSLALPFLERSFSLLVEGGGLGTLTTNAFMKREYGRPFIEKVLPRYCLQAVIDTSGCYFPGHGTPTCILFVSNHPPEGEPARVGSDRAEPSLPANPAQGQVWAEVKRKAEQLPLFTKQPKEAP
jgi:SAM-dependent methyltransferase